MHTFYELCVGLYKFADARRFGKIQYFLYTTTATL